MILVDALLPPSCAACGEASSTPLCTRCEESVAAAPPDVAAAAMFGGALADAVRAAKFRPDVVTAEQLCAWFAARVPQCAAIEAVLGRTDAIAFVPAPFRRRVARGFDLPALLAQSLARVSGKSVVDALECTRTDAPLSHGADKAARAVIVKGRYRARGAWTGQRLALVDDVRTTGATLAEARGALEAAGAAVDVVTLAIAP